jgi:hypothetical protein
LRAALLKPLNVTFSAPDMVALYLYSPDGWVVENFNVQPVTVVLNGKTFNIPARDWICHWGEK